jgi:hypothetical protein
MKEKNKGIYGDNNGEFSFYVDLNDPKSQDKIVNYIKYGVSASDSKHGHHVRLQCKVIPVQADILQSVREKAPGNYWKSQSDLLRSVISVGTYVIIKFLNEAHYIKTLKKEFQLQDIINLISRNVREGELEVEARKAIYGINTQPFDPQAKIEELVAAMNKKK